MFTRREWSELAKRTINDQLGSIESAIGTGGVGTPKRSQRDAMLGVTQARLGMANPNERGDILSKAQSYITGGSSFGLKPSQTRQLGQLAQISAGGNQEQSPNVMQRRPALGARYSAPDMNSNEFFQTQPQEEGLNQGGIIPGEVNRTTGDDLVAIEPDTGKKVGFKKGEYVFPVDVVDYLGVEKLDKEVERARQQMGLKRKKTGYDTGGWVDDTPPIKTTGIRGARGYEDGGYVDPNKIEGYIEQGDTGPVQAVQTTPQGYAPVTITPEAADKLYKAWGLDKESPNWNPSYGSQVNTLSPMGRTVQVVQPNAQGVMPGVTLPRGRSIPMGLTQKQFDERAGEENMLSGMAPKVQGAYLEGKEKVGIDRRKVDLDAELNPARKAYLLAQTEESRAGAGLKRRQAKEVGDKSTSKLTDQEKIEARDLSSEERQLRSSLGKMNAYSPTYKKDKKNIETQLENIRQRKVELGVAKVPAEVKTKGPDKAIQAKVQELQKSGMKNSEIAKHMKAKGLNPALYGVK